MRIEEEFMFTTMMTPGMFLMALVFTAFGVALAAIFFYFLSGMSGAAAKIENVMYHHSRALSAWCVYATVNDLQNAYPVGIEIESDASPFGIIVKKVVVVVKSGFREKKFLLIRADEHIVDFREIVE